MDVLDTEEPLVRGELPHERSESGADLGERLDPRIPGFAEVAEDPDTERARQDLVGVGRDDPVDRMAQRRDAERAGRRTSAMPASGMLRGLRVSSGASVRSREPAHRVSDVQPAFGIRATASRAAG